MTKLKLTLAFGCFFGWAVFLNAQEQNIKWGKIPPEHLRMTTYEKDTSASAIILYDYGVLNFDLNGRTPKTILERHTRIKILKRSGFDYGDVSIPYYSENGTENVHKLKAAIYNPDGSSEKLKNRDFFEEEIDGKWSRIKFTFPNLQEGSVIEYSYMETSEGIFTLPEWYFQHEIPVFWSEYELYIPKWYTYVTLTQGNLTVNEQEWTQGRYSVRYEDDFNRGQTSNVNLEVNHTRYAASMLPGLKEEAYITTMDDYRARVRMQLSGTNYEVYKPVMGDWRESAKDLMEEEAFGVQLTRESYFKPALKDLAPLLEGVTDPVQKTSVIYDFVNQKMEWNGDYSFFVRDKLKDWYTQQTGTSGELNLLLIALLKANGIEAYPILTSTRTNGRMTELYPILDQFNHAMAYVQLGDSGMILDAGNSARPMGMPQVNALNGTGWLVHPSNPQWIPIKASEGASVFLADFQIDEEGMLAGSIKELHKGYNAVDPREEMNSGNCEKKVREGYVKVFPDAEIEKVAVEHLEDTDQPLTYSTQLSLPDMAQIAGEFIYLSPVLMKAFNENPFKLKERQYPVDMPYPMSERYIFKLQLPEGYGVEELPEPMAVRLPGNTGAFHFEVRELAGFIQLISTVEFKKTRYEPQEYAALQNFVDVIIDKQNEQIVLKMME